MIDDSVLLGIQRRPAPDPNQPVSVTPDRRAGPAGFSPVVPKKRRGIIAGLLLAALALGVSGLLPC